MECLKKQLMQADESVFRYDFKDIMLFSSYLFACLLVKVVSTPTQCILISQIIRLN